MRNCGIDVKIVNRPGVCSADAGLLKKVLFEG